MARRENANPRNCGTASVSGWGVNQEVAARTPRFALGLLFWQIRRIEDRESPQSTRHLSKGGIRDANSLIYEFEDASAARLIGSRNSCRSAITDNSTFQPIGLADIQLRGMRRPREAAHALGLLALELEKFAPGNA